MVTLINEIIMAGGTKKRMNYIRITKDNIDKEHICCAMSGKQSVAKKECSALRMDLFSIAAKNAANALSNTFQLKTPGCRLRQMVIFTLTAYGYPAP